jgi:glycosyltransferase involved in cell wall biosynthesis
MGVEVFQIQKKEYSRTNLEFPLFKNKLNTALTIFIKTLFREKITQNKQIASEIIKVYKLKNAHLIWFSYANISLNIIRRIRQISPNHILISDTDSVWSRYILRATPFLPPVLKIINTLKGLRKISEEVKLVRLSNVVLAVSEEDQRYYSKLGARNAFIGLSYNVIDLEYYQKLNRAKQHAHSVLLAGTYGSKYSPMDNAANWFLKEVWPLVVKKYPESSIYLVGRNSNKLWKSNPEIGIYVEGEVPSILPYLEKCSISVVPLWYESGTRFKILEAAAAKVPVVSTTLGAEGLFLKNRLEILIANTPDEFVKAIFELFESNVGRIVSENAYKKIEEKYTIQTLIRQVKHIIDETINCSRIL